MFTKLLSGLICALIVEKSSLCFATSQPLRIKFSNINAVEQVGHPFMITLTSDDPNFSGMVYLNSTRGMVAPTYIKMHQGTWKGPITLYEAGTRDQLIARWINHDADNNRVSLSNSFDVNTQLGALPRDAEFIGNLKDDEGMPNDNARIELYADQSKNGQPLYSTISDHTGHYELHELIPGKYYVAIVRSGYATLLQPVELGSQRIITKNSILAPQFSNAIDGNRVPILLVPGTMGSTTGSSFATIYPRVPTLAPAWNSGELSLLDPFFLVGWHGSIIKGHILNKGLEATLIKQGYRLGTTLFEVPYDWSLSIPQIRDNYLLPWIAQAKRISGSKQVDIIAHSMGGIVVRDYIQSKYYKHDVRRFAMAGTPNQGSDTSYYIWEGGDPITPDLLAKPTNSLPPNYFYSNTINYLAKAKTSQGVCTFSWYSWKPRHCDAQAVYNLGHNIGPSVGQLIPTMLIALINEPTGKEQDIISGENILLKALNNMKCLNPHGCRSPQGRIYHLNSPDSVFSSDASKVQTALFAGVNQDTLETIDVNKHGQNPFYQDGLPAGKRLIIDNGDGTVLADSVSIPKLQLPKSTKTSLHSFLIKNYNYELASFITGNTIPAENIPTSHDSYLVIETEGDVQPTLSILDNQHYTLKSQVRANYGLHRSTLVITNPQNGNYALSISSPTHKNYQFSINYFSDGDTENAQGARFSNFANTQTETFNFNLQANSGYNAHLSFGRFTEIPALQQPQFHNNQLNLAWQANPQKTSPIAYYDIYAKRDDQPYFVKLAQTEQNSYSTSLPIVGMNQTGYVYAIDAVYKDGTQSVMSSPYYLDSN